MAEYIERNALLRKIRWADTAEDCVISARRMPLADVVPVVHGHWIKKEKYSNDSNVVCSECKMEFDYIDGVCYLVSGSKLPHYCPNCGAKMDWEEQNNA